MLQREKVAIIEVIEITSVLEVLPIVLKIEKETILLVILYRMPAPLVSFIDDFSVHYIHGGILDLVFDTSNSSTGDILMQRLVKIFCGNNHQSNVNYRF